MITVSLSFSFGASQIGLSDLRVQPRAASGAPTGSVITNGFVEIGRGVYVWSANVPDDARFAHAGRAGDATILCVRSIQPPATIVGQPTGNGDRPVDHDTGGTDALRIMSNGQPVDDALISAYVAGNTSGQPDAQTRTGTDGRWAAPLMLDPGTYTLVISAANLQAFTIPITVT